MRRGKLRTGGSAAYFAKRRKARIQKNRVSRFWTQVVSPGFIFLRHFSQFSFSFGLPRTAWRAKASRLVQSLLIPRLSLTRQA